MRNHSMNEVISLCSALLALTACEDVGCTEGDTGCLHGPCRAGSCEFDLICSVDNRCMAPDSFRCDGATADEVCTAMCLAVCARSERYCGFSCGDGACSSPQYLWQCKQDEYTLTEEREVCSFAYGASCDEWWCAEDTPAVCDRSARMRADAQAIETVLVCMEDEQVWQP